jgi:oxygen-independent coproporphyrinogen-3 oxidase
MQENCQARLALHGYAQYEVSAFAREERRCRHNLNYWEFGDYIGIGAGAHGKLTDVDRGRVLRTERPKQPRTFLNRAAGAERVQRVTVSRDDLAFEFLLNALRLSSGFTAAMFEARTGRTIEELRTPLADAAQRNLLTPLASGGWRPTELGLRFLNDLQALFLPDAAPNARGAAPLRSSHPSV